MYVKTRTSHAPLQLIFPSPTPRSIFFNHLGQKSCQTTIKKTILCIHPHNIHIHECQPLGSFPQSHSLVLQPIFFIFHWLLPIFFSPFSTDISIISTCGLYLCDRYMFFFFFFLCSSIPLQRSLSPPPQRDIITVRYTTTPTPRHCPSPITSSFLRSSFRGCRLYLFTISRRVAWSHT